MVLAELISAFRASGVGLSRASSGLPQVQSSLYSSSWVTRKVVAGIEDEGITDLAKLALKGKSGHTEDPELMKPWTLAECRLYKGGGLPEKDEDIQFGFYMPDEGERGYEAFIEAGKRNTVAINEWIRITNCKEK